MPNLNRQCNHPIKPLRLSNVVALHLSLPVSCHIQHMTAMSQMLFSHLNREPPVGYNRVSVSQLLSADKAAWCFLIEKNLKPRPDAAGVMPLNTGLEDALKSYEVSFTLLPMISKSQPKAAQPSQGSKIATTPVYPNAKGQRKGGLRSKPYGTKGKGKNKSKFEPRIPQQIREAGGTASTPDGDPICFDYSLKRCKEQVTDGRCRKGFHVCCLCYGPPLHDGPQEIVTSWPDQQPWKTEIC